MTTEEFFKNLLSGLELKDSERHNISNKHTTLRENLRGELEIENDFLTGSYNRNTIIRPKDSEEKFDVDFFLAFNKDDYGESKLPELLKIVKNTLDKIKDDDEDISEIQEQKRSIGVVYNDNFQIDVVPAIQIEKDKKYKIFDKATQQSIESNPKLHGNNLTSANEITESGTVRRLVPIVKLLKSWKRDKCEYVKSFHLEMLVVKILGDEEISSYSEGLTKFFINAGQYLQTAGLEDPANKENIIDEYLDDDGKRDELLNLIADEKEIAEKAVEFGNEDNNNNSIKEWRKIFESNNSKDNTASHEPIFIDRTPSRPHCNV
ncbi:hypothetical protein KJ557_00785 [Patescibacteria group bacterium]|nr:hypothetical protein [Patescibacteria group bacterium]